MNRRFAPLANVMSYVISDVVEVTVNPVSGIPRFVCVHFNKKGHQSFVWTLSGSRYPRNNSVVVVEFVDLGEKHNVTGSAEIANCMEQLVRTQGAGRSLQ